MSLEATLDVTVGNEVVFAISVTNPGDSPVELTFRSSKVADVVVTEDGAEVWRWSEGRMFAQMMNSTTIDPGDEVAEDFVWEDPEPGEYVAVASLNADTTVEAEATFTV